MSALRSARALRVEPTPVPAVRRAPATLLRSCACESSETPCSSCGDEETRLHRDTEGGISAGVSQNAATQSVNGVVGGSGQALPARTRNRIESRLAHRFGSMRVSAADVAGLPTRYSLSRRDDPAEREADAAAAGSYIAADAQVQGARPDLSAVRIHAGSDAAAAASSVAARAFTLGNHVVFGAGQYAPDTAVGERLLTHELAHVLQTGGRIGGRIQREEKEVKPPDLFGCKDRRDITVEFKRFVRDSHALIGRMQGLADAERSALTQTADFVLSADGAADLSQYKVVCCSRITSVLLGGGEAFAEIDSGAKELLLGKVTGELLLQAIDPAVTPTKEGFTKVLQTLAHEKRHVTLGNRLKADPGAVRPDLDKTLGPQLVQYRAEEILAVVEEQAVGRKALGPDFMVEVEMQMHLHRQRNMIQNFSSEAEWQRLRTIILEELRDRYGRRGRCDTSLTIGVMRSLDRGSWFWCSEGRIIGDVPPGVVACEEDGRHRVCSKPS